MTYLILSALLFMQNFLADDPVWRDEDTAINVAQIARRKLNDYYDFLLHTFGRPGDRSLSPAVNTNTLGEVPDSTWFENRHGLRPMSLEALVRGPNTGDGPSMDSPWVVVDAKNEGITPGFRIVDGRGDSYFIKFDPATNPEMATAAEVISTKFFYAMGYNVPENYLAFFTRDQLRVDEKAKVADRLGRQRRMSEADLDRILERVHRKEDGTYRAVASKLLNGVPLGPFQYFGTRPDDPNDIFPHENRRELRGLGVISAWLNHDDSRAINSLDVLVGEEGSRYVKHYLIDFGSTLGSGSVGPQKPRAGWEFTWEPRAVLKRVASLGLIDSGWVRVRYPNYPSIGRFESKQFKPNEWKPEYPNPAFLNLTEADGYWAAKLVMSFTDEQIRAIVRTGELSDAEAEDYLVRTLIERRDKVGRHWLTRLPSFDRFKLEGDRQLSFEHLASVYGFARTPEYRVHWRVHNDSIDAATIVSDEGDVTVYVRTTNARRDIVGIERQSKNVGTH